MTKSKQNEAPSSLWFDYAHHLFESLRAPQSLERPELAEGRSGYLLPSLREAPSGASLRRERNPSEAENSSHCLLRRSSGLGCEGWTSSNLHLRFSAKGDKFLANLFISVLFLVLLIVIPFLLLKLRPGDSPLFLSNLKEEKIKLAGELNKNFLASQSPEIKVKTNISAQELKKRVIIQNSQKKTIQLPFEIKESGQEKTIIITPGNEFKPGIYYLEIMEEDTIKFKQDFTWGVLAINLNQSSYFPGEQADIYMTVLDNVGQTVCDANVDLNIISPSGKKFNFNTTDTSILRSDECQPKNFTYQPDFKASFTPQEPGIYKIYLKSETPDGERQIEDYLTVSQNPKFIIQRQGPTRLYPPATYEMKIKILAKESFSGVIQEKVPTTFSISDTAASINTQDKVKVLNWSINLKKDEESLLNYSFKAPDISPEFYLLGPLSLRSPEQSRGGEGGSLIIFEEPRAWQLAADAIASNIIVAWPLASAVPAGWTRDTTLDSKYLKGAPAGTNPGTTGGSATHTHTVPNHSHSHPSHSHPGSTSGGGDTSRTCGIGTGTTIIFSHSHPVTVGAVAPAVNSASVTLGSAPNDPPYFDVLWIKSNGTNNIPASAVAFFDSTTPPSGWSLANGAGGTVNLNGNYLRGATGGGNAGDTGGSLTHTHSNTAHTHTIANHSHTGTLTASSDTVQKSQNGAAVPYYNHTHTFTSGTALVTSAMTSTSVSVSSKNGEPPYYTLAPIQNTSGSESYPDKIIAVWTGTLATIPSGWFLCDGTSGTPDLRSKFIKGSTTSIDSTGGNLGHSHTSTAHSHAYSHSHTAATSSNILNINVLDANGYSATATHTHTVTLANEAITLGGTTVTIDNNADTQPPYYEVAFIQYQMQPPSNCYVTESLTNDNLTVYWTDNTVNEDQFDVYRSDDGGAFAPIVPGTAAANATSYLDNTTTSGHTYAYQIRATQGAASTGWCTTLTYDTLKGNFKFEGVKMEGVKINLRKWETFLSLLINLFRKIFVQVYAQR